MPYAVTKAAQFQLVKCLAVTVGPEIRVNTVLPGLLLTEWVSHYPSQFGATKLTKSSGQQVLARAYPADQRRSGAEA